MYKKIASVITDDNFEMIELALNEPNIFRALSIERKEIRHSNFIGYILDPKQNHGLKDLVLKKFLRDIFFESKLEGRDIFDADTLNLNDAEIRREWRNIDLLIILKDDVVVVENKVDTSDHSNQLNRYEEIAKKAFHDKKHIHYVYLTPQGSDPNSEEAKEVYINYSYEKIALIIQTILDLYKNSISEKIYFYLSDYLSTVKRDILMSDNLNELAVKVYNAHKEAFDFIIENKPDPASILYGYFENAVKENGFKVASKNKGYIRFTTSEIDSKLPKVGSGWPDKEILLFEIDYYWTDKYAIFNVVIAPCESELQNKLHEALKKVSSYKTPTGKKWLVVYKHKFSFVASEIINEEEQTILKKIDEMFKHIKPITEEFSTVKFSGSDVKGTVLFKSRVTQLKAHHSFRIAKSMEFKLRGYTTFTGQFAFNRMVVKSDERWEEGGFTATNYLLDNKKYQLIQALPEDARVGDSGVFMEIKDNSDEARLSWRLENKFGRICLAFVEEASKVQRKLSYSITDLYELDLEGNFYHYQTRLEFSNGDSMLLNRDDIFAVPKLP